MKVHRDFQPALEGPTVLTVGNFDGLHRGHQAVLGQVVARARALGARSLLVTFDPHPLRIIRPELRPLYLTSLEERLEHVEALGVEAVHILSFTPQLREKPPQAFAELLARMQARQVWVGPDFRFGHDRAGDVSALRRLGQGLGFQVEEVAPLEDEGGPVSSSRIRRLVVEGRIEEAAGLLGREPTVEGTVVPGADRGAALGYPTANLEVDPLRLMPKDGIYAVRVRTAGLEGRPGVASIGTRPTFEADGQRLLEVHLFDFAGSLYGQAMRVSFVRYLRPEERFPSAEALVKQMRRDELEARAALGILRERSR